MAEAELITRVGGVFMLKWTVPDTPVVNKFIDPDGTSQDFPDDGGATDGAPPSIVEITVKRGTTEADVVPDRFRKNRTPPLVAKTTIEGAKGEKRPAKVFTAIFRAREEGVFLFEVAVKSEGKSITQKMVVKRRYNTIQEVIDDPTARRRQAILANIADFFPAFNTHPTKGHGAGGGVAVDKDSGHLDQGPWKTSYPFDGLGPATSCTDVNPKMMTKLAQNDETRWAFGAGPAADPGDGRPGPRGNRAWVFANKDTLPSVGDTYIVLNKFKDKIYGHVGIVLEVPPSGNGLWITADGGQGARPQQLALIVPRLGIMAAHLPVGGRAPNERVPEMKPEPDGAPFLAGGGTADVNHDAPMPARHDDIPGMIARIRFKRSEGIAGPMNPRRLEGFVDVDSEKLSFLVDGDTSNEKLIEKCKVLQAKVEKVAAAYMAGRTIGAPGT